MMVLKRKGKWLGEYRFRYYVDGKAYGSNDRKRFYSFKIPDNKTDQEIMDMCGEMVDVLIKSGVYDFKDFIDVRGSYNKFHLAMSTREWAHIKIMSKEEAEKENGKF